MPLLPDALDKNLVGSIDTVIFVDVDGVLNVGARDPGHAPVLFSDASIQHARRLYKTRSGHPECDTIERLVSIADHDIGHGENATYEKFACSRPEQTSDVLVGRLAQIIKVAGDKRLVVLASTWRKPNHRHRVMALETAIARHLGAPFSFDARTALVEECHASSRLRTIGDFLSGICNLQGNSVGSMRVLLLEDFCITRLGNWSCEGRWMSSENAVEAYLRACASGCSNTSVKLIHTYDEWTTPSGLTVNAGVGLSLGHLREALQFLCQDFRAAEPPGAGRESSPADDAGAVKDTATGAAIQPACPDRCPVTDAVVAAASLAGGKAPVHGRARAYWASALLVWSRLDCGTW